jgi:hypothetical protein
MPSPLRLFAAVFERSPHTSDVCVCAVGVGGVRG